MRWKKTPSTIDHNVCARTCPAAFKKAAAEMGLDVVLSTAPPIVYNPYTTATTCPHGTHYWLEPTGEMIAARQAECRSTCPGELKESALSTIGVKVDVHDHPPVVANAYNGGEPYTCRHSNQWWCEPSAEQLREWGE